MFELPNCPKCSDTQKMVPLSKIDNALVVIFSCWKCVKCLYEVNCGKK